MYGGLGSGGLIAFGLAILIFLSRGPEKTVVQGNLVNIPVAAGGDIVGINIGLGRENRGQQITPVLRTVQLELQGCNFR